MVSIAISDRLYGLLTGINVNKNNNNYKTKTIMKKKNLFSKMLLLLSLIVVNGSMWAADGDTHDFAQEFSQLLNNNASISSINIDAQNYPVKQVKIHYRYNKTIEDAVTMSVSVGGNSWGSLNSIGTGGNYTYAEFSGNAVSGAITISFTNNTGNGTGHGTFYVDNIQLVEGPAAGTPSITANDVPIAYNATNGSIAYSIANGEGNVSASVTSGGDWLTLGTITASEVPFTCSANPGTTARTATVTLSYTGATDKVVTVTQAAAPVTYTTIPALFEAATTDGTNVNVSFGNWVVSGVSGSNAYVTDNNGNGFIIYTSNHGFAVNNKLSGTVTGTPLKLYKGSAEFTNLTASTSGLTVSNDGEITIITNKTIADLGGVNTGAVIRLSNLTYDGTDLSDGTNTIQPYSILYEGTFVNGKTYNVTGVYLQYDSKKEILPRSAADIVEVVAPSITLSENTVEAPSAETDGTITVTYNNLTNYLSEVRFVASDGTTTATYDWLDAEINSSDATKLDYSIAENTGTKARTAYMKVYAVGDEGEAYSELITITQDAYVAPPTPVDGYYVKITSTADITDGQYLIVYEGGTSNNVSVPSVAFNGGLATLDGAKNGIPVTISSNKIQATTVTQAAEFTINVTNGTIKSASGLYIGRTANSNGLNTNPTTKYENSFTYDEDKEEAVITASSGCMLRYNYASDQLRFRYFTNGQQPIQLYKYIPSTQTIERTKEYTTFCSTNALDFTAYVVSAMTANSATIKQVFETPAGTGLILKRTDATKKSFTIPVIETASAITPNYMVGVNVDTDMSDVADAYAKAYILKDGKFYKCSGGTLAAGKAYLNDENGVWATSSSPSFSLIVDGETTGIDSLTPALNQGEGVYYDLSGRRIAEPTKGIYILNGRKVVVK